MNAMCSNLRTVSRQAGIILPLLAVSMLVIVGMMGLTLDMGHMYLSKTRLQNALDAAALSAAKTLDDTNDTVLASAAATTAFNNNAALDMDSPVVTLVTQFSPTLIPFVAGGADPKYVRVRVVDYQQDMWFAQVLPGVGEDKIVGATAVAGPSPVLAEICDIAPIMVCGDASADDDCGDGSCYGYSYDPDSTSETILKSGAGEHGEVGPGNYQLVNLAGSTGGNGIRYNLAGGFQNCLNIANNINTATGNNVGPVAQGLNTRFGMYNGPFSQDDRETFKPDLVSDLHSTDGYYYSDYLSAYVSSAYDHLDGEAERRIVSVPIGDCSTTTNGTGSVPVLGLGCFFLTRPAEQNGEQRIYGQFVDGCSAHGVPGPEPVTGPGPHIIILYKDPDNVDA